jgi:hypothetical protein
MFGGEQATLRYLLIEVLQFAILMSVAVALPGSRQWYRLHALSATATVIRA